MEAPLYRSARQRWLGETLTMLQRRGFISSWQLVFEYRRADPLHSSLATWLIHAPGIPHRRRGTAAAEKIVQAVCDANAVRWIACSPPGGIEQYRAAFDFVFNV